MDPLFVMMIEIKATSSNLSLFLSPGTKKDATLFFTVGLETAKVWNYNGFFAVNRMNVS